jgi:CHAT domain-containing protein
VRHLAVAVVLTVAALTSPVPDLRSPALAADAPALLKKVGDEIQVGANRTGEPCRLRLLRESPSERYGLFCDGWSAASGLLARFKASRDLPPDRLLTDSPYRKDSAGRLGGCGSLEAVKLADGSRAVLRECQRLDGGWRVVVVVTEAGKYSYILETFPTNLSLLEFAVDVLKGNRPAEATTTSLMSTAIRRAETMLEKGGQLASVQDIGARTELYALGRRYDFAANSPAAEATFRRVLDLEERVFGVDHPESGLTFAWLGQEAGLQGRFTESDALFDRAGRLIAQTLVADIRPQFLTFRSLIERARGRVVDAVRYGEEAIRLRESGPNRNGLAESLVQTGRAYCALQRFSDCENAYFRVINLLDRPGPDPEFRGWRVGETYHDLGELYLRQGKFLEARQYLELGLKRRQLLLGSNSVKVAVSLRALARLGRAEGDLTQTLEAWRRVASIETTDPRARDLTRPDGVADYLAALNDVAAAKPEMRAALAAEAFIAVQIPRGGETAKAITAMAARLSVSDPTLQGVARAFQDASRERDQLRQAQATELFREPIDRDPDREAALKRRFLEAEAQAERLEQGLQSQFPQYARLTAARPVPYSDVAALLRPGEAMLVFLPTRDATYVVLLRDGTTYLHKADLGRPALEIAVKSLRASMNVSDGQLRPFDIASAYRLYASLIAPLADKLTAVTHLVTVPGGPLQSIPVGLFLTQPLAEAAAGDYRQAAWLAKSYAISVVPTVAAFRDVRAVSKRSAAPSPFIGFGDPLFSGDPSQTPSMATLADNCRQGPLADVELVRALPRLRETATELRSMARALGAPPESVVLGAQASETAVRAADLSQYRVIAFATHGLLPAELKCKAEPALALTPPATPTLSDDGLLDASEVAQLKIDADWVLLSACNTAAPDGRLAGESLSGLARAFFYAGARALVVSHWAVVSQSTVLLTTALLEGYAKDPALGRAEALRRAQATLWVQPTTAHPVFWAPFVMVGDGGPVSRDGS